MTIYEAVASGNYSSGRAWSFRHYFNSAATLSSIQSDWSNQIISFWTDGTHGVETLYPTSTELTLTKVYQLNGAFQATSMLETTHALAGTSANDGLPDQDSILVTLRTAGVGTNNRGRTFLPAPDETIVTGDLIGSTQATRVSTAMTALRTGMGSAGHTQVIFNRKVTKHDSTVGVLKPVTSCLTDRVIRTQRRRIRKEAALYV